MAALLAQVRRLADEIVVGVDSRLDPAGLGSHASLADRVLRFEYAEPFERVWPWLLGECSGEWILWLDGSEVLSARLVERLPKLVSARDLFQYRLPCYWVLADHRHCVAGSGPCSDAPKLVRNDAATLWSPGTGGRTVEPVFPSRHAEVGYYRLDRLVGRPGEPGTTSPAPQAPEPRPTRVPRRDRGLVSRAIRATTEAPEPSPGPVRVASRAEIDRHWPERAVSDEAYDASITCLEREVMLRVGEHRPVFLRVTNRGTERWPWGSDRRPLIRLAYRWLDLDGSTVVAEGFRTELGASVDPGATTVVPATVAPPGEPGTYLLELDLVHEFVRWFGCGVRLEVSVVADD